MPENDAKDSQYKVTVGETVKFDMRGKETYQVDPGSACACEHAWCVRVRVRVRVCVRARAAAWAPHAPTTTCRS
jgi:hypothetical protein